MHNTCCCFFIVSRDLYLLCTQVIRISHQVSVYLLLKAYSNLGDTINEQLLERSLSHELNTGQHCLLVCLFFFSIFSFCISRAYAHLAILLVSIHLLLSSQTTTKRISYDVCSGPVWKINLEEEHCCFHLPSLPPYEKRSGYAVLIMS